MNGEASNSASRPLDQSPDSVGLEDDSHGSTLRRAKRIQTSIACTPCQKRKSKCDGQRPTCSLCQKRLTKCGYDGESASRRLVNLRRLNKELDEKIQTYEAQITLLRNTTNPADVKQAVELLNNAGDGVANTIEANRHFIEQKPREAPHTEVDGQKASSKKKRISALPHAIQDSEEATGDRVSQKPDGTVATTSLLFDGEERGSWLEELSRFHRWHGTARTTPRDYLEIFGESRPGSAGKGKDRSSDASDEADDSIFNSKLPVHLIQPCSRRDDSPLSRVISDYKIAARSAIAHGVLALDILGPPHVDVSAFLSSDASKDAEECLPRVDKWASLMNKSFEDVDVFVRLGSIYLQWCLMRWMIHPTRESYAFLPNIVKPTIAQLFVPHVAALDFLSLPCLRDALIMETRAPLLLIGASLSCNWTDSLEACLEQDAASERVVLSDAFRDHVARIESWSVSPAFLERFPELEGQIRVEGEPVVKEEVV